LPGPMERVPFVTYFNMLTNLSIYIHIVCGGLCLLTLTSFCRDVSNHDWRSNPDAQIQYSATHPRWIMPGHYFSRTWELGRGRALQIVFIDTIQV
jgi:hypothetical protein